MPMTWRWIGESAAHPGAFNRSQCAIKQKLRITHDVFDSCFRRVCDVATLLSCRDASNRNACPVDESFRIGQSALAGDLRCMTLVCTDLVYGSGCNCSAMLDAVISIPHAQTRVNEAGK